MKKVILIAILIPFAFLCCATSSAPRVSGQPGPEIPLAAPATKAAVSFSLAEPFFPSFDLSKLRVGMTKAEVRALFSNPMNTKQTPKDEYWEYVWFELYFRNGRLVNWFML